MYVKKTGYLFYKYGGCLVWSSRRLFLGGLPSVIALRLGQFRFFRYGGILVKWHGNLLPKYDHAPSLELWVLLASWIAAVLWALITLCCILFVCFFQHTAYWCSHLNWFCWSWIETCRSALEQGLNDRMSFTGSRVTSAFLKRRAAPLYCAQRSLSITSLWGQKKEENPDDAAKKVNFATIFTCLSKYRVVALLVREITFIRLVSNFTVISLSSLQFGILLPYYVT